MVDGGTYVSKANFINIVSGLRKSFQINHIKQ